jgi:hypothetical protein
LLLHGSADARVHPTEALTMTSKLYECQHSFRFVFFEGLAAAIILFLSRHEYGDLAVDDAGRE